MRRSGIGAEGVNRAASFFLSESEENGEEGVPEGGVAVIHALLYRKPKLFVSLTRK